MTPRPPLQTGRYRHYKNLNYEVIDVVRHSETTEWMVLYRAQYGDFGLWVRPYAMFFEQVVVNGESVPRFAWVGPVE
ncbi:DUF1653 domain-containing protein [Jeongeupia naejangsanensis]|uniref:DUF1653 domain-containing protein n=1 Tax=Jeongeupia naejangsanensis TaxID=613195 RepID=A0ABS2BI95_9NEIS|nr:DUF1653 domain-containing protein [Jeongeupia naejangsanensis]MBM3115335.1 DUF1653 domain-containing protein [Jeongeupia naejangsanensis]